MPSEMTEETTPMPSEIREPYATMENRSTPRSGVTPNQCRALMPPPNPAGTDPAPKASGCSAYGSLPVMADNGPASTASSTKNSTMAPPATIDERAPEWRTRRRLSAFGAAFAVASVILSSPFSR